MLSINLQINVSAAFDLIVTLATKTNLNRLFCRASVAGSLQTAKNVGVCKVNWVPELSKLTKLSYNHSKSNDTIAVVYKAFLHTIHLTVKRLCFTSS